MARILFGCENSATCRIAFEALGHDAWSCDILPSDIPGKHLQCDVLTILDQDWDMALFFPSCQYLCSSGLHWNKRVEGRQQKTEEALDFVQKLLNAPIEKICLENPIGCINTRIMKPTQIIQPYFFGENASKATCLFLKNLPKLIPTNILKKPDCGYWANQTPSGQNKLGPSKDRWKLRSKTYFGIAAAMAKQWNEYL